jgi:thiol-disulfide isomerase/thioredoxin
MLYLDKADFVIGQPPVQNGQNGNKQQSPSKMILKNKITNGFSLIMFSGNDCVHCKELKPVFEKLVGTIQNCQIGTVNVSLQPGLAELSQQTTTPIRYVPLVLFYINGTPFKEFGGNYTEANLRQFVKEVSAKAYQLMGQTGSNTESGEISQYSIGKPVSKRVCYLNFESAYNGTPPPSTD